MFSGLLEKTTISLGAGVIVGIIDAVGFYYSAKLFITPKSKNSRIVAGILEVVRLIFLVAIVVLLNRQAHISIIWLLAIAFFISLGGKFFFIFKRMKA